MLLGIQPPAIAAAHGPSVHVWGLRSPGIMENIFDGIQRPLQLIYDEAGHSPFVPLGVDVAALDR